MEDMDKKIREMKTLIKGIIPIIVIVVLIGGMGVYTVNTGEVAIVSRFGKVISVQSEGLHVKIPFTDKISIINTRESIINAKYEVSSKDIQSVTTEVAIQYKIVDPEKVYRNFQTLYQERLLFPRIAEIVQSVSSKYTIEELIEKRQLLSLEMHEGIKRDVEEYGILITKVSIVNHDFSEAFEKAIEEKKIAQQNAQKQQIELEQQFKKAEMTLRIKSEEAKANKALTESLTKEVLYKMWLEKWNGQLPQVVSDKTMVQIPVQNN